ncbi:TIGR02584 family CRISPR-associated protein [candidate division KSB1 bacterium]|nr:TIGR02584 family CRISPR-associated protein [candidate division KSB1 bacterium]
MKQVLLSLCGRTPQILTETLYCLMVSAKNPIHLDEIWIVTTRSGKDDVCAHLLNKPEGKFYQFCRDFAIDASSIRFTKRHIIAPHDLSDIQNVDDNESFANVLTEKVWNLTKEPNTVLHCSIAGGRKTMSAYLAMIMQFFARPQDRMFHILTGSPDFDNNPAFYYPPPSPQDIRTSDGRIVSTRDAGLVLVDIPFIRLRGKIVEFQEKPYSFSDMVKIAQQWVIDQEYPQLSIDVQKSCLGIGEVKITLTRLQTAIYALFALQSLYRANSIPRHHYDAYFIRGSRGFESARYESVFKKLYGDDYDLCWERIQQERSRINRVLRRALPNFDRLDYYEISIQGPYKHKCYGIKLDKQYISIL